MRAQQNPIHLSSLAALMAMGVFVAAGSCATAAAAESGDAGASRGAEPAPQGNPLFLPAHEALLEKRTQGVIDVYFLGDSITRRWHANDYPEHQRNWEANFHGWNAANFGWGGDSTQNVLWRLEHGALDGVEPKVVVLMIGTNNLGFATPPADPEAKADEVVSGIRAILDVIGQKAPEARIVLMGITPRNNGGTTQWMQTIERINARIAQFADGERIVYLNINDKLLTEDGQLREGVTSDGLHLSNAGYQVWADALKPLLHHWLGPPAEEDHAPPPTGIPEVANAED